MPESYWTGQSSMWLNSELVEIVSLLEIVTLLGAMSNLCSRCECLDFRLNKNNVIESSKRGHASLDIRWRLPVVDAFRVIKKLQVLLCPFNYSLYVFGCRSIQLLSIISTLERRWCFQPLQQPTQNLFFCSCCLETARFCWEEHDELVRQNSTELVGFHQQQKLRFRREKSLYI